MKLHKISKGISYSKFPIGILFVLMSSLGYAAPAPVMLNTPLMHNTPGSIYVGAFGGGGSTNHFNVNQYGTAFYPDAVGGPVAVNAFGSLEDSSWLAGGHLGYQWAEVSLRPLNLALGLSPAFELEGYYLGKTSFTAHDVNNDTTRLPEHDFVVTYPIETGVFLTNAVLNFNSCCYLGGIHPYVGVGIGGAVASISHATATQIAPPEPGVNHFNSNASDTASTFAGQVKVGLNFDLGYNLSLFLEYRWLYLSSTSYAFGSTVYPGHFATSNWQVKMDPHDYNIGTLGIQYSI